jgi:hypothetical protein
MVEGKTEEPDEGTNLECQNSKLVECHDSLLGVRLDRHMTGSFMACQRVHTVVRESSTINELRLS